MLYDEIIVGSGPCAYSYLLGKTDRSADLKIKIISTESICSKENLSHPKLYSGNKKIIDNRNKSDFGPTANLGGLSHAWGGVLVSPIGEYKNGHSLDKINGAVSKLLADISENFIIYCKRSVGWVEYNDVISKYDPPELFIICSRGEFGWENGKTNIFPLIEKIIKNYQIKLDIAEVINFTYNEKDEAWGVVRRDGEINYCKKLILAAGALGNLELLNKYLNKKISTYDHVPYKIYAIKLPFSEVKNFSRKSTPVDDVKVLEKKVYSFYSIDSLSSDFIFKIMGINNSILRKIPFPFGFFEFIQCWTVNTYMDLNSKRLPSRSIFQYKLDMFKAFLGVVKYGFIPLYIKATKVGEGFHYAGIKGDSNTEEEVFKECIHMLKKMNMTILGGISFESIRPEHPTFSFMVDSYLKSFE